jgi:putative Mg2+ transporter-C (MgtC) family protein
MDLTDLPDVILPLIAAMVAGGLIGLEREWRGRSAGFRTHILVCLASALLMEAAVSQGSWRFDVLTGTQIVTDPTRMAHGVLTGIGFLCAGVIFRAGFSIHGLTTAASLWITASLGLLFGAGLFLLGVTGTALTVVILVLLRLISRRLPQSLVVDVDLVWRRADLGVEPRLEAVLEAVDRARRTERLELVDGGESVRRRLRLKLGGEAELKALAARLADVEGVTGYTLEPRSD